MIRLLFSLLALLAVTAASASTSHSSSFWQRDIWQQVDRPFLFYGESEKNSKRPDEEKKDLSAILTLEELQTERTRRLAAAIMDPRPEFIESYLEINAFVLAKSQAFADAWRDRLMVSPQWDWTASHPVVNAASTRLARERQEDISAQLAQASRNWGLIFFGDDSRLTEMMIPIVERFAERHRFELVRLALPGTRSLLGDGVAPAGSLPQKTTPKGLTQFPALVLVRISDASLSAARLIATGVVDYSELARRAHRVIAREEAFLSSQKPTLATNP